MDRSYRGRRWVTIAAFGFYLISMERLWRVIIELAQPWADDAWRYWIRADYDGVSATTALLLLGGTLFVFYFAHVTLVVVWTLLATLVWNQVESDRRIYELLSRRLTAISVWWARVALFIMGLGVLVNLITPGFQRIVGGD